MGLHCSHYHGRGKWGSQILMWKMPRHFATGATSTWGLTLTSTLNTNLEMLMGEGAIDLLREKSNDTSLGRAAKREVKDIAKHYRSEFKRIYDLRAEGVTGKITIESWS